MYRAYANKSRCRFYDAFISKGDGMYIEPSKRKNLVKEYSNSSRRNFAI
jgi:hypothetical protein